MRPVLQALRPLIGVMLTLLLGAMLLVTIYYTLFDLEWIAFLAGILFAAVLALASQASKSSWMLARRNLQIKRMRRTLAEETQRAERAGEQQKETDARTRFVLDALPSMVFFADREHYCRYHNRAFAFWCRRNEGEIDGRFLQTVLGADAFHELKPHCDDALTGQAVQCELDLPAAGASRRHSVSLQPYPLGNPRPAGYYAILSPAGTATSAGATDADLAAPAPANADDVYLESMTAELTAAGKDPRSHLVSALARDQFILFAQPIRALSADAPHPRCYEVLLRMEEEERAMVPPGGFIPVAERYNMMSEIDRWVVRNVIKWCLAKQLGDPAWQMPLYCLNLAQASLCEPEFALYVMSEIKRQAFPGEHLCFEIAEADALARRNEIRAFMQALRPLGCRFTLDGFGSSKVSFEPLKHLQFDILKIDGVIIQNLLKDKTELARTRAIASASRKMGMHTIAEFVEDDATIDALRGIGVDYVQGFGIGKPGPIALVS